MKWELINVVFLEMKTQLPVEDKGLVFSPQESEFDW